MANGICLGSCPGGAAGGLIRRTHPVFHQPEDLPDEAGQFPGYSHLGFVAVLAPRQQLFEALMQPGLGLPCAGFNIFIESFLALAQLRTDPRLETIVM